jgi:uncharacterized protein YdaU (DUF1376 family)
MLAEVINLDLRERGALFTLVDLMYVHGGSVPDKDDFIRRYLGCNARGWHALRDRLLHLEKIYRDDAGSLRSSLVDRGLKEARRRQEANSVAGMISQAKRRMSSKLSPNLQEVSNFADSNSLKSLVSASTGVQPYQTPDSRYKKERAERASPSPALEGRSVASKGVAEGRPEGPKSEAEPIIVTSFLAQQVKSRWSQ